MKISSAQLVKLMVSGAYADLAAYTGDEAATIASVQQWLGLAFDKSQICHALALLVVQEAARLPGAGEPLGEEEMFRLAAEALKGFHIAPDDPDKDGPPGPLPDDGTSRPSRRRSRDETDGHATDPSRNDACAGE